MTLEVSVLIGIITCFLGVLTFFLVRMDKARGDATSDAVVKTTMQKDIEHILEKVTNVSTRIEAFDQKNSESIRRIHDRFDEHLAKYHSDGNKSG